MSHLLVDGQNIAHIVHGIHMHRGGGAAEELTSPNGQYTTILKGTLNMIGGMLTQFGPQNVIVAYDGRNPSWRYDIEPTYKGGLKPRSGRSPFGVQLNEIGEHLKSFGIQTLRSDTLEGDDIVALLSEHTDLKDKKKVQVSDDRDLLAYVGSETYFYSPKIKKLVAPSNFDEYTKTVFKLQSSVGTTGWPLFRALAGDTGDNIKGVNLCGPAYAAEIVKFMQSEGAKLTGYKQPFNEILPQVTGLLPIMPKKLQKLLTESGLDELRHCYDLVRVANAPNVEKELIRTTTIEAPVTSVSTIQNKLKDLGFRQWENDQKWMQKFANEKDLELGI